MSCGCYMLLPTHPMCKIPTYGICLAVDGESSNQQGGIFKQHCGYWHIHCWLVVEPYPFEKSWSESQLGWWHSQYDGKVIKFHGSKAPSRLILTRGICSGRSDRRYVKHVYNDQLLTMSRTCGFSRAWDFPLCFFLRWLNITWNTPQLVDGAITILKNMSSSMGRMTSHILWKIKLFLNHQPAKNMHVARTNPSGSGPKN